MITTDTWSVASSDLECGENIKFLIVLLYLQQTLDRRTPNKEHLQEMGMLFEPAHEEWYKRKRQEEKMQKRLDFDQHVVRAT